MFVTDEEAQKIFCHLPNVVKCRTSRCMAWRLIGDKGYCGLAGAPILSMVPSGFTPLLQLAPSEMPPYYEDKGNYKEIYIPTEMLCRGNSCISEDCLGCERHDYYKKHGLSIFSQHFSNRGSLAPEELKEKMVKYGCTDVKVNANGVDLKFTPAPAAKESSWHPWPDLCPDHGWHDCTKNCKHNKGTEAYNALYKTCPKCAGVNDKNAVICHSCMGDLTEK